MTTFHIQATEEVTVEYTIEAEDLSAALKQIEEGEAEVSQEVDSAHPEPFKFHTGDGRWTYLKGAS